MKLVIDIPEEIYRYVLQRYKYQNKDDVGLSGFDQVGVSIKEGTPLPEHHGRLIDADKLRMDYCNDNCGERKCVDALDRCVFIDAVLYAPTIIEADKECEEE